MHARAIEESEVRLSTLRRTEWESFGLGVPLLTMAVAASQFLPAFALPLFVGGLTALALGIRGAWRRWELVDRLVGDRDAYAIEEVRKQALREASTDRRHDLAISVRLLLKATSTRIAERVAGAAEDLEALACDLDDEALVLEPAAAVACARLLRDPTTSPLFSETGHADEVRSRVRQIRCGFDSRRVTA